MSSGYASQGIPLIQYLSTNGDGSGTVNAVGNYSGAEKIFYIQPPKGTVYIISELLIHLADSTNFSIGGFGSRAALVNGVTVRARRNGVQLLDITGGQPIKTNPHLTHLTSRYALLDFPGGGNSITVAFHRDDFGVDLTLNGDLKDTLEAVLHDDFSSQDDFHFIAHGYY